MLTSFTLNINIYFFVLNKYFFTCIFNLNIIRISRETSKNAYSDNSIKYKYVFF